ncbi:hypothetical protein SDC9_137653 [bioreactor metagenome]|uniref:Uncharacterized protein n=1 Tax=bioreactor metagenome TaxID=1076179 RepID=A0A645DPX0_9ZZZZ
MYGQYDPTQYESNKYSAYLDLIKEAIQVVATYNIDTMNKAPTNIVIEKQYNNNQSGGNFQTGDNSTVSNTVPSDEKNWFSKEVVKTILAFISGVGATLLAQYLMRLFGWIK